MNTNPNLELWVAVWLATACYLVIRHWRSSGGVGLLLTYVLSFGVIYCLAAALQLLPWFVTRNARLVAVGMQEAGMALLAFAVGAELGALVAARANKRRAPILADASGRAWPSETQLADPRGVRFLLIVGFFVYAALSRIVGPIPSLAALLSTGSAVFVMAIGLEVWNAWQMGRIWPLRGWLTLALGLPLLTIITQGFLGYGFAAMLTVFAFAASFIRPRWKVLTGAVLIGYLGLSVYTTYMRDRNDIREVVWGGSSLGERAAQLKDTLVNFEWFNPYNELHLQRVDKRLDQDFLVGAAVTRLDLGFVPFANGSTLSDAALSIIPRALWPNKPIVAGSGDLVSIYTGIRFAEGTSVGVGQVLEFYINFGLVGLIVGFVIFGFAIAVVDRAALRALQTGDVFRFTMWYLPGLGLLQVGGSLVEVVSTAGAGLVMAWLLSAIGPRVLGTPVPAPEQAPMALPEER